MTSRTFKQSAKQLAQRISNSQFAAKVKNQQSKIAVIVSLAIASESAHAQYAGISSLCTLATWLKAVAAAVGVLAILVLVVNSFFGKSDVIGEIVTKVLMGCVIAGAAGYLISSTGIGNSCTNF